MPSDDLCLSPPPQAAQLNEPSFEMALLIANCKTLSKAKMKKMENPPSSEKLNVVANIRKPIYWLAFGLSLAEALPSRAAAPRIEIETTVHDFGKTSRKEDVTGSFVFRNTGDEELRLDPPTTTCGCTVATLKSD